MRRVSYDNVHTYIHTYVSTCLRGEIRARFRRRSRQRFTCPFRARVPALYFFRPITLHNIGVEWPKHFNLIPRLSCMRPSVFNTRARPVKSWSSCVHTHYTCCRAKKSSPIPLYMYMGSIPVSTHGSNKKIL